MASETADPAQAALAERERGNALYKAGNLTEGVHPVPVSPKTIRQSSML